MSIKRYTEDFSYLRRKGDEKWQKNKETERTSKIAVGIAKLVQVKLFESTKITPSFAVVAPEATK